MAYNENDPHRFDQPVPAELVRSDATGWIVGAIAVVAVISLIYLLLPSSSEGPRVTENAPRTEAPAKPFPPTLPPPSPPAEKPNPPPTPQ
jgi:hypothetical protein